VLDEIENLRINRIEDFGQRFLLPGPVRRDVLASEPNDGGMLLASNCRLLI